MYRELYITEQEEKLDLESQLKDCKVNPEHGILFVYCSVTCMACLYNNRNIPADEFGKQKQRIS